VSRQLVTLADEFLAGQPYSILDREPSDWAGDAHDYYSVGNYSWPNPETADGLPYIRVDGRRNPDAWSDRYDKRRFRQTVAAVNTLVQAHLRTGCAPTAFGAMGPHPEPPQDWSPGGCIFPGDFLLQLFREHVATGRQ